MRFILSILLISCSFCEISAQLHQNKPLPQVPAKPAQRLGSEMKGWSLSLDGQWLSEAQTIPVRGVSTNESYYDRKLNQLGLDNIEELQLFPILYGQDTLLAIIKVYRSGNYKREAIQQAWRKQYDAYYYVFDPHELAKLDSLDSRTRVISFNLRDFGQLKDISPDKARNTMVENLIIKEQTARRLALVAQVHDEVIHFQFASIHKDLDDVAGVLHDFRPRGESLYGTTELLEFMHYAMEAERFKGFFRLPANPSF